MSIRTIRLNLKNNRTAQPSYQDGGAVSAVYSQLQQQDQPKVLYEENTLPLADGIRAAALIPQTVDYSLESHMSNAVVLHTELATDVNSNAGVIMLQVDPFTSDTRQFYMRRASLGLNSSLLKFMDVTYTGNSFLHKRTTLFQNRTLLLTVNGDSPTVSTTGSGTNGVYEFDFANSSLIYNGFSGINVNTIDVQGITSHENYLILFSKDTVYWSSPLDLTDFSPALGGGGSAKVAEARGAILTVIPYYNGLMIHCAENTVSMTFSGDTTNPWIFREVPNSAGLFLSNSNFHSVPLACINEQQQVQYVMSPAGLYAITENGAQALPEDINEYITSNFIETKPAGLSTITYENVSGSTFPVTKLQNMFSFGPWLMMIIGQPGLQDSINRLVVYNTNTRAFGTIVGNWRSVHKQVTLDALNSGNTISLQKKPRIIPDAYVLTEFNGGTDAKAWGLNLQTRGDGTVPAGVSGEIPTAEVLVGNIQVSLERTTALHSVSFGPNDYLGDGQDQLKVYAFDVSTQGGDTPVEFTFNPADNKYYGYIEGKDIKVLLVGKNFFLTVMELETETGGFL